MNIHQIRRLPAKFTKLLQISINRDNRLFWAWVAEIVDEVTPDIPLFNQLLDVRSEFSLLIRLMLLEPMREPVTRSDEQINDIYKMIVDRHSQEVLSRSHTIASYLAFPILEGLCRALFPNHISPNGRALQKFAITRDNGTQRTFGINDRVNRIHDVLYMVEQLYGEKKLQYALRYFKKEMESVYTKRYSAHVHTTQQHGYEIIDEWRNELSHGTKFTSRRFAVLINLMCMIWLYLIPDDMYRQKMQEFKTFMFSRVMMYDQLPYIHSRASTYYPVYEAIGMDITLEATWQGTLLQWLQTGK